MFVVRDADTTVYIFGTFHALDGQGDWLNPRVRSAFESSDELVLETLIPEGAEPAALPARPLPVPLTPSASFLATTRMTIDAGKSQGMQVANGADMVLRHIAEQEGKPVEALETLESQFAMFARLPPAPKSAGLVPGAPVDTTPMESLSQSLAQMQSAWKRGDQSVFLNMLVQLNQASPTTYRMLFTDRNARWADWVAARLQTPGTVFVAVGAGHLAGKDSLLVRLAERRIESRRVD
jgi:uncharacterized protein YbaP (TraB family)